MTADTCRVHGSSVVLGTTAGTRTAADVRRLQREWYARLRDDGFDDIEYGREDGALKVACRENRGLDALAYESTCEYFSRAEEFLYRFEWQDDEQRAVWRLHVEGASLREIAKARSKPLTWAFGCVNALKRALTLWRAGTGHVLRRWDDAGDDELVRLRAEVRRHRARRIVAKPTGLQMTLPIG